MTATASQRREDVDRAIHLELFTIFYNLLEGAVSLLLGGFASSIALIGFGLDSFIESSSGLVVFWRFRAEARQQGCSQIQEQRALRYVGWSFLLLSAYIVFESLRKLLFRESPAPSFAGILLALVSLIVMPILSRRKRRVAEALNSGAMLGDSKQTLACSLLSAALLVGLALNAGLGWWWADPVAGLAMVPWLSNEGYRAVRGEACCG